MALYSLRPQQKLLQAAQFSQVFDNTSFKVHQAAFLVLVLHAPPSTSTQSIVKQAPRLGLVVAKKKLKHAHERNRFKRIVRDSFRLNQHVLPPVDLVFLAKSDALNLSNAEIFAQLQFTWKKIAKKYQEVTQPTVAAST